MRSPLPTLAPFAAALLLTAAAGTAAAQPAAASTPLRSVVQQASASDREEPFVLATYRIAASRTFGLPARVTVADSAGWLVASYREAGDPTSHPMLVTVLGTHLVLEARTRSGVLTLRLDRQNDTAAPGEFAGRWSLDAERGELRGRVVR